FGGGDAGDPRHGQHVTLGDGAAPQGRDDLRGARHEAPRGGRAHRGRLPRDVDHPGMTGLVQVRELHRSTRMRDTVSPGPTSAPLPVTKARPDARASDATRCDPDPPGPAGRTRGRGSPAAGSSTSTGITW